VNWEMGGGMWQLRFWRIGRYRERLNANNGEGSQRFQNTFERGVAADRCAFIWR
jgi:hypothetical protein